MSESQSFLQRLRNAGIAPGDDEDLRLQKTLLVFISGLVSVAAGLWLLIYWAMGPQLSATLPFVLQILVALNVGVFIRFGNFNFFRFSQLGILLFFPFMAQWAMGDFVAASGLVLWGLLAPIGALLCLGVRESMPWFIAYVVLTFATGAVDYLLADAVVVVKDAVPRRISILFFALNFITISTIVYLLLRLSLLERLNAREMLEFAHARLKVEQSRTERLLLNILPEPIAHRLRTSDETIADGYAEVTVMFADIVRFTELAAHMRPPEVFSLLNRVFSRFDELAEARGLEKIKTIGDAYMVAGGLTDGHIDACTPVALLALDIQHWLKTDEECQRHKLAVRIGIGTGPVIAGVVGKRKFIYDLWGDTVNLASRITDESIPGGILCDETTYARLPRRFRFSESIDASLKGKGMVRMWPLQDCSEATSLRRQAPAQPSPTPTPTPTQG
ncbi:MAG: adenylate/guanylate cyclase domain-containing protein [Moraxellaceae bacterium]|nr:adenylate/guanylate cyclase domain-containing protein [Moraxellaceae bacterium]